MVVVDDNEVEFDVDDELEVDVPLEEEPEPVLTDIVGIREAAEVGRDADALAVVDDGRGTTLAAVASANIAKTATIMP